MIFDSRIRFLIVAIFVQLCLGLTYIWSLFQIGIADYLFSSNHAAAGLTFSFSLAMLGIGSAIGGILQDKFGPKPILLFGGLCLSMGFYLSSYITPEYGRFIYITYGIIGGFGMGSTYATTIAVCQKWYPDKRGLVTGIIVASLGMGGVIFAPLAEYLIVFLGESGQPGIGELRTFAYFGLIIFIIMAVATIIMKNPPTEFQNSFTKSIVGRNYELKEALKTKQFYIIAGTIFLASMAGLMMIAFAKPIGISKGIDVKVVGLAVVIISIFNAAGRLFWGAVSDRLGRKAIIIFITIFTAISIILVGFSTGYTIFILIAIIGFGYGGLLGVFPALTSDFFGTKNFGIIYGLVMMAFGFGAVTASYIAGYFKSISATDINLMFPAYIFAAIAAVIGGILISFLKPIK